AAGGVSGRRNFFYWKNRLKKLAARPAVLLRNLDPHEAQLKELVEQRVIEDPLLVHLFRQRANLVVGKLTDVVAEQNLVFGKSGERRGIRKLQSFRHGDTSL